MELVTYIFSLLIILLSIFGICFCVGNWRYWT